MEVSDTARGDVLLRCSPWEFELLALAAMAYRDLILRARVPGDAADDEAVADWERVAGLLQRHLALQQPDAYAPD